MKKDIENLTIGELTEMGFWVDVSAFDCKNLQESYNKMKPFTKLSSIEKRSRDGIVWTKVEGDINGKRVNFTAFIK